MCGVRSPKITPHASVAMGSASSTPSWEIKNRCTRWCLGDCDYGTCLVPHPIMERDMTSMMGSRDGCTEQFHCRACDGSFNLTTGKNGRVTHDAGPKWCFEGTSWGFPKSRHAVYRSSLSALLVMYVAVASTRDVCSTVHYY